MFVVVHIKIASVTDTDEQSLHIQVGAGSVLQRDNISITHHHTNLEMYKFLNTSLLFALVLLQLQQQQF